MPRVANDLHLSGNRLRMRSGQQFDLPAGYRITNVHGADGEVTLLACDPTALEELEEAVAQADTYLDTDAGIDLLHAAQRLLRRVG